MKKNLNCVNCGAPLHSHKCEYCGTEYEFDNMTKYVVETSNIEFNTLSVETSIPLEYGTLEGIECRMKQDIAKRMTDSILEYTEYETWLDPRKLEQVLRARVKVGIPRS